jgi:hypothetical protein
MLRKLPRPQSPLIWNPTEAVIRRRHAVLSGTNGIFKNIGYPHNNVIDACWKNLEGAV